MGAGDQRVAPAIRRGSTPGERSRRSAPTRRPRPAPAAPAPAGCPRRRRLGASPAVGASAARAAISRHATVATSVHATFHPQSLVIATTPLLSAAGQALLWRRPISRKGLAMTAPFAHRPTIAVTRHAIAAGHYLAATAGFAILEAGGNAIDAGCAAGIALGVLQSDLVDVAGVAPIMIYLADKPRGRDDRRARPLAEGARPRIVHARARRQDPEGRVAHRRPGRARRLDHRAPALGHDELWRGRGGGDPARARRLPDVPADGREPEAARGRPSRLAVVGGDLSAGRPRAGSRRTVPPDRSRRAPCNTWPTRSAPPPVGAARPGSKPRATPSTAATSPRRSSPS